MHLEETFLENGLQTNGAIRIQISKLLDIKLLDRMMTIKLFLVINYDIR